MVHLPASEGRGEPRYPITDVLRVGRAPGDRPTPRRSSMKIVKLAVRSTGAHSWRRASSLLAVAATIFATPAMAAPVVFHVSLGQASSTPVSGRLLVFAKL